MTLIAVPFANLHKQYLSIRTEIDDAIAGVIADSAFVRGPRVEAFEQQYAQAMGSSHCISAANGTDTLFIAMHALGVKPGDEVIVPAMSWISTSETVTQAGGKVVFCDVDPETHTIDVNKLAGLITSRTVGIIPVHLYGYPAEMDEVMAIAARYDLWVIEDCAQAHSAIYKGRTVGTIGTVGSFSFYPGKNLGAMGDAGALLTEDPALARRMAMFARHGGLKKGHHEIEGINSRLDGLQAAILSVKLPHLQSWTLRRREIANLYREALSNITCLSLPKEAAGRTHVYHLYVVLNNKRDGLLAHLRAREIQAEVNYMSALPFLPCYGRYGAQPSDFVNAHRLQEECLSLPIFPEMSAEQISAVIGAVQEFFGNQL